jgi:MFS transporter, DHA2 family, multidrug resistance protein
MGMFYSSQKIDLDISFGASSMLRLAQVFGLGFLFVPINLVAYVGMPAEKSGNVAGMVNFMRNMGSSVGTSVVTTLLARRAQVHQAYLAAHVTLGTPLVRGRSGELAERLTAAGVQNNFASRKALGLLYQSVIGQATLLAYVDIYATLAAIAAIMFVLSFALRKNQPGGGHVVME